MAYKSNIGRVELNDIVACKELSYQLGLLLGDKLGKMEVEASNYYPSAIEVQGVLYTIEFECSGIEEGLLETYSLTYQAAIDDTVTEVIQGLKQYYVDTYPEGNIIINTYTDKPRDVDKYMFFIPKDGYILVEKSKTNLSSDPTKVFTPSDTIASYAGYSKNITSTFPRIIVTPMVSTTSCARMEEGTTLVDGVETEYTSSYVDYSMNISCEAGDMDEILKTGYSAQYILNLLRKRLCNEIINKRIQNSLNSVIYPIDDIVPVPAVEATQYMSIARCTMKMSCLDVYYPEERAGFMEEVILTGATVDNPKNPDGILYKYLPEDERVEIYGAEMDIDRRDP